MNSLNSKMKYCSNVKWSWFNYRIDTSPREPLLWMTSEHQTHFSVQYGHNMFFGRFDILRITNHFNVRIYKRKTYTIKSSLCKLLSNAHWGILYHSEFYCALLFFKSISNEEREKKIFKILCTWQNLYFQLNFPDLI